jgi:hypothetical protein
MRGMWLIVVGIPALGCKGDEASRSVTTTTPAAATSVPSTEPRQPGPAPVLEVQAETEDKLWADATEKSIRAVAPELGDVTCVQRQCRATVTASTQEELVAKVEALQAETSLRQLDARSVLLGAVEQQGGKPAMTIYVRFDR